MDNERERFRLWWEYLKRSKNYILFRKYRARRRKNPEVEWPKELEDYNLMLLGQVANLFGDIEKKDFDHWWERYEASPASEYIGYESNELLKEIITPKIKDFNEVSRFNLSKCAISYELQMGKKPTLNQFIDYYSQRPEDFTRTGEIVLSVNVVGNTLEKLTEKFKEIVSLEKKKKEVKVLESNKKKSRLRIDELERYLKVFDLKEEGLKWKEIVKIFDPSLPFDDVRRSFLQDYSNAKKIIKNAEQFDFPGSY